MDNGFSLMVRVPGTLPVDRGTFSSFAEIDATKLIITSYINSQWLKGCKVDGQIAKVIQTFVEGVACPHIRHLKSLHRENKHAMKTHIPPPPRDDNSPFIPIPEIDHPCHFEIRAFRPGVVNARLDKLDDDEFDRMAEAYDWMGLTELADKLEAEETTLLGSADKAEASQSKLFLSTFIIDVLNIVRFGTLGNKKEDKT